MTAQDSLNVIKKFWEALQHPGPESLQAMTDLMDENIDWEVIPLGKKYHGIDELKQLLQGMWAHAPKDAYYEITNMFATKDWACVEYTARGTVTKELGSHLDLKMTPSGQKMEIQDIQVYQLKNGKIASSREYYDQATLMRQLGVPNAESFK